MIKCIGYYTEPERVELDYEKMGLPMPEPKEQEMIEAVCYLAPSTPDNPIQCIFQIESDKVVITYLNGFEALIKKDKDVIAQLI